MDRTTESVMATVLDVTGFYDWLAGDYDSMTGFQKRFVRERPFFKLLVENNGIRAAVDAGSGTGFHSLVLAELGVEVTAIDLSERMVEALRLHAQARGVSIRATRGSFTDLPRLVESRQDAVFCLGNSLPHILTARGLDEAFHAFREVLAPGALLLVQLLNYRRILAGRETVLHVHESDGVRYTRSYAYGADTIYFTISRERLDGSAPPWAESVELRPWTDTDLLARLTAAGFTAVRMHGGITLEPYDAESSRDLVLLARVPAL